MKIFIILIIFFVCCAACNSYQTNSVTSYEETYTYEEVKVLHNFAIKVVEVDTLIMRNMLEDIKEPKQKKLIFSMIKDMKTLIKKYPQN